MAHFNGNSPSPMRNALTRTKNAIKRLPPLKNGISRHQNISKKYFCHRCFNDQSLIAKIQKSGIPRKCSLCKKNGACLGIARLIDEFQPLVKLYSNVENFMPLHILKSQAGNFPTLVDKINCDWQIFQDDLDTTKFLELCHTTTNIDGDDPNDDFDPGRAVEIEDLFYHSEYQQTYVLKSLWSSLKQEIQSVNRFFAGRNFIKDIVNAIKTDLTDYVISTELELFRVRSTTGNAAREPNEMGAPIAEKSTPGRANPAGIPYLYLASDKNTAVCEVRPHQKDKLTIGTFKPSAKLKCVDLRNPRIDSPFKHEHNLQYFVSICGFLRHLGEELSKPIGNQKREYEYLPTQYLCELIKNLGYDGVIYRSGVSTGYNIALFSPNAAYCVEVQLVEIKNIEISFGEINS